MPTGVDITYLWTTCDHNIRLADICNVRCVKAVEGTGTYAQYPYNYDIRMEHIQVASNAYHPVAFETPLASQEEGCERLS